MTKHDLYKPSDMGFKRFSSTLESYLGYDLINDSFTKKVCIKHQENETKLCGFPNVDEARSFIGEYLKNKGREEPEIKK